MNTLVVYESMYGNTHAIATAIAEGIRPSADVRVIPVGEATAELVDWADLVIAGGPTHARGMTSAGSRESAVADAAKPDDWNRVTLDPAATGPGIREWLDGLPATTGKRAAAFDTRAHGPALFTGRASNGIARGLRAHGFRLVSEPESFVVDWRQRLLAGEEARATEWAASLASELAPAG